MDRGFGQAPTRRFPRMCAECAVAYRLCSAAGPEGDPQLATTRSVGLGGLMFESGHPIERGVPLLLEVVLEECTVRAAAQVVYADRREDGRWNVGVQFTEISEADRDALLGAYLHREYRIPPV